MKAALLAVLAGCVVGDAEASAARCEGCNEHEMSRTALSLGAGRHAVSSFATDTVKFYEASLVESDGTRLLKAVEADVPEALSKIFKQARDFYLATDTTFITTLKVNASDLDDASIAEASASDVANNRVLQARIGDRLIKDLPGANSAFNPAIDGIRSGVFSLVGMPAPVINFVVTMNDGSRVGYRIDEFAITSAKYQPELTRDVSGDLIES